MTNFVYEYQLFSEYPRIQQMGWRSSVNVISDGDKFRYLLNVCKLNLCIIFIIPP